MYSISYTSSCLGLKNTREGLSTFVFVDVSCAKTILVKFKTVLDLAKHRAVRMAMDAKPGRCFAGEVYARGRGGKMSPLLIPARRAASLLRRLLRAREGRKDGPAAYGGADSSKASGRLQRAAEVFLKPHCYPRQISSGSILPPLPRG